MDHIISYLLLGIATNIDNLTVGTSYGIRARNIYFRFNVLIGVLNATTTFLSMLLGNYLREYISEQVGDIVGNGVFLVLGVITLGEFLVIRDQQPEQEPVIRGQVGWREAALLGLSLSFSNLASGVGAGIVGLDIPILTLIMFGMSMLPISLGQWVGQKVGMLFSVRLSRLLSGCALVGLGLWRLAETFIGGA